MADRSCRLCRVRELLTTRVAVCSPRARAHDDEAPYPLLTGDAIRKACLRCFGSGSRVCVLSEVEISDL